MCNKLITIDSVILQVGIITRYGTDSKKPLPEPPPERSRRDVEGSAIYKAVARFVSRGSKQRSAQTGSQATYLMLFALFCGTFSSQSLRVMTTRVRKFSPMLNYSQKLKRRLFFQIQEYNVETSLKFSGRAKSKGKVNSIQCLDFPSTSLSAARLSLT